MTLPTMTTDRVRERREALKLTQAELATLAGVKQSQVSAAESTNAHVSRPARAKILAALTAAESAKGESSKTELKNVADRDIKAGVATLGTTVSLLETAVGRAFDSDQHLIRDANAVLSAFGAIALPQMSTRDLVKLCRQWLDAAAALRGDGVPVTSQALVAHVALRNLNTH